MAAYLVSAVGARWPRLVTWRPLAFLGQHSLVVVAAQSVLVIILVQFDGLFATVWRDRLVTAAAVAFLFAAAWIHQKLTTAKAATPASPNADLASKPSA